MSVKKVTVKNFGGDNIKVPISDLSNFRAYDNGNGTFMVAVDVANNRKHRTPLTTDVSWSVTGSKDSAERHAAIYNDGGTK